jgi:phage protein D
MSDVLVQSVRRPRLQVLANGAPLAGVRDAEVSSNSHYGASRFSLTVALGVDTLWTPDYWSAQSSVMLEVQVGFVPDGAPDNAAAWVSLILGAADTIEIELPEQLLRVHGRDLTAVFLTARTQETFANQTSSEIAATIAARQNLTAAVTPTSGLAGRYYEIEHDQLTLGQFSRASTEWDLLVFLAQQEGYDVFVEGSTLYFQPPQADPTSPDATLRPNATANGPANLIDLRMERCLALAGNVEVTVKSWNSRQGVAFTQSAGAASADSGQNYQLVRPNLLPDQAAALAQNWLEMLTQHERVITARMPGEVALTPRSVVALEGTGTAFDQAYYVDTIDRQIRFDGGFVQRVRAKNSTARS